MIDSNVKLLAIGFNYWEINEISNYFSIQLNSFDFDFAVSVRDSLYRLSLSNYDVVIINLDETSVDEIVSLREGYTKVDNLKSIVVSKPEATDKIDSTGFNSYDTIVRGDNCFDELTQTVKRIIDEKRDPYLNSSKLTKSFIPNLIDAIHDQLVVIGVDYKITNVNNQFYKKYKLNPEDVLGKCCYEFFYDRNEPCDDENRPCPLKQVIESRQRTDIVHYFKNQSRHVEYRFNISAFPTYNEFNTITQVYLIIQEVKKSTEYKIDHVFLNSLIEGMNEGFIFFDSSNNISLINTKAENLLDLSRDSILGNTIFKLPLGKGLHWLGKLLQEAKTKYLEPSTIKVVYGDRNLLFQYNPLFDKKEKYYGGFLFIREFIEGDRPSSFDTNLAEISKFFSSKIVAEG